MGLSFTRMDAQGKACAFGTSGVCCRICHMGPCRISAKSRFGVCGADADTIVARNFLREVAGGAAAHSDHGRHLVLLLKKVAEGNGGDYTLKDARALSKAARLYGVDTENKSEPEVARALARTLLREFTAQEDTRGTLRLAPKKRQGLWDRHGASPAGIDRMIVESMHRTHMGVDHDTGMS